MFTLARSHLFVADPEMCSLWAGCGYAGDCFSWELCLHSKSKSLRLGIDTELASFAITLHPPLGAKDWRHLGGNPVELPPECHIGSFYFHFGCYGEWEDLLSLDLRFGEGRGRRVEVWANGSGSVEAATDLFPDGQVEFQIHTWAAFRGVAVNVPLNTGDPVAYSEARIRAQLPHYAFSAPVVRKTNDNAGVLRAVEVLFAPNETVN